MFDTPKLNSIRIMVGDSVNGKKITMIQSDPFVKDQVVLWTNETQIDELGDGERIGFRVKYEK